MIQLIVVFSIILLVLKWKKPLYLAIMAGIMIAILLYKIPGNDTLMLIRKGTFQRATLELLLAFYGINLLQQAMDLKRKRNGATSKMVNPFVSNRLNIMLMPFLMGLLPSVGAVVLAAPVVDDIGDKYLKNGEKTFVTSYFRHISEGFLPTYSYIILAVNLSGISMGKFQLAMLPSVVLMFFLGYIFYVRKIPRMTSNGKEEPGTFQYRMKQLLLQYWAIILLVILIIVGDVPLHIAVFPVAVLYVIINKFRIREMAEILYSSIQFPIMVDTIVVMIFIILFFWGALVIGSQAVMALGIPLAFASIPNGGVGLLVLLVGTTFFASQMTPTHVCLSIATEYFHSSFWELTKKTFPIAVIYIVVVSLYSVLLRMIF
jgi:hypothetical protein